jgi:hypothetical protein
MKASEIVQRVESYFLAPVDRDTAARHLAALALRIVPEQDGKRRSWVSIARAIGTKDHTNAMWHAYRGFSALELKTRETFFVLLARETGLRPRYDFLEQGFLDSMFAKEEGNRRRARHYARRRRATA